MDRANISRSRSRFSGRHNHPSRSAGTDRCYGVPSHSSRSRGTGQDLGWRPWEPIYPSEERRVGSWESRRLSVREYRLRLRTRQLSFCYRDDLPRQKQSSFHRSDERKHERSLRRSQQPARPCQRGQDEQQDEGPKIKIDVKISKEGSTGTTATVSVSYSL